jgi:hypothetical protein
MKEYSVVLPVNMKVCCIVEANSESEAIDKALMGNDLQLNPKSKKGYEVEEWDIYTTLLEGNFWYGIIYEAEAEEI